MCNLIPIQTNTGEIVKVASIKADTIKKISELTSLCSKIDYIYIFGSSLTEKCTHKSDIDIAIISNITRSKLFRNKEYTEFTNKLYGIDPEQDYDILQFNSLEAIKKSKDIICMDILIEGRLIYSRKEDMKQC